MRSACCHNLRSTLSPVRSCGHSAPVLTAVQRRPYSLDRLSSPQSTKDQSSQYPRTERLSPSSALTQRNLSAAAAVPCRPLCQHDFLDVGEVEENVIRAQSCKGKNMFIVNPELANLVTKLLGPEIQDPKTVLFECNPGPGVLTRTLLKAGAQRVVALEENKSFLHELQELESHLDGQLEVVYCDYFKLDPVSFAFNPPVMTAHKLFTDLGISEVNWTDDVPVKVVGIVPQQKARSVLWRMVYTLMEQLSVFRYGRIELNLFMSEKDYKNLVACPGDGMEKYRAFSVLWQIACDIELLHKEPWDSFVVSSTWKPPVSKGKVGNDNMCLVRLRPRADLFSSGLQPSNASTLFVVVKQCMASRKRKVIDRLNLLSLDSGSKLLSELGLPEDILTGQVYPEDYLRLFLLMNKSQEFKQSWLFQEYLENT